MSNNLPAVNAKELGGALAAAKTRIATESGDYPFLRLLKSGEWVYSADDVEVQEGSLWAINPASFSEGYVAWGKGSLEGEEMQPMTSATPIVLASLPDVGHPWKKQVAFILCCMNGEDEGQQVLYKASSKGGLKAANAMLNSVIEQIEADPAHIVPTVELEMDSYKHKEYGKIYTPIFAIDSWINFDGMPETEKAEGTEDEGGGGQQEEAEATPPPATKKPVAKKKRRRAIAS